MQYIRNRGASGFLVCRASSFVVVCCCFFFFFPPLSLPSLFLCHQLRVEGVVGSSCWIFILSVQCVCVSVCVCARAHVWAATSC